MLRGLSDPTPYGTLTIRDGHAAEIKTDNSSGRIAIPSGDKHLAPVGTVLTLRTCDKYAVQISHVAGAPAIEVYWPDADRDRAVKDCAEFLAAVQRATALQREVPLCRRFSAPDCHLTFPLLDHPAAAKEAESVQAIFSLENQGERRLVKSLTLPMKAKWVTLKKYPWDQGYYDTAKGEGGVRVAYLQDCWVWQAEEVLVNGQWQRYYGVVGPHQVGKVAASEIEFPSEPVWSWSSLSARRRLPASLCGGRFAVKSQRRTRGQLAGDCPVVHSQSIGCATKSSHAICGQVRQRKAVDSSGHEHDADAAA